MDIRWMKYRLAVAIGKAPKERFWATCQTNWKQDSAGFWGISDCPFVDEGEHPKGALAATAHADAQRETDLQITNAGYRRVTGWVRQPNYDPQFTDLLFAQALVVRA